MEGNTKMEGKTLSLSNKLDGGYLHVKKKDKQESRSKGGGYSNYLKRLQRGRGSQGKHKEKVVAIKLGGSRQRKRKPSKTKSTKVSKDISMTPIIPLKKGTKPVVTNPVVTNPVVTNPVVTNPVVTNPVVTNPVVANPVVANPVVTNPVVTKPPLGKSKGGPTLQMPTTKGPLKKPTVVRRGTNKRSLTKRRKQDHRKGKRISVTKVRKLSNKDISSIQGKLKEIKKKSTDDIKKELDKQGIRVSGKSPTILKDIYMYSQLCGINIKRE